ncbi:MAG: hypothetical protein M1833_005919 [Piccolia ochrophora]|nr:MAG: hypothetical protein M1833_005919 [Piccolia ochrophora]
MASHVRRLWLNGYNVPETDVYIFRLLQHCRNLLSATLPWTVVHHGSVEDWKALLGEGGCRKGLVSLELLAVDLKQKQVAAASHYIAANPFQDGQVDFSGLKRLKIFGDTKFRPIGDDDLEDMAATAVNLEEVHVTGNSSVGIQGVMALVTASCQTLRVLEFSPLSHEGFMHPDLSKIHTENHLCEELPRCTKLRDLSISLPSLCPQFFSLSYPVRWSGDLQIRAATLCGEPRQHSHEKVNSQNLRRILDSARAAIEAREHEGSSLDIEIFISNWIFDPRSRLVHGDFDLVEVASDFTWPPSKMPSGKGPYGQTGLYEKEEGQYSSVSEETFFQGLQHQHITF